MKCKLCGKNNVLSNESNLLICVDCLNKMAKSLIKTDLPLLKELAKEGIIDEKILGEQK